MILMDGFLAAVALTVCAVLVVIRRYRSKSRKTAGGDFDRLAEVVKSAEVANDGFFRALELVQKNLETLIARAESTEQRLRGLMLNPGVDKREQYTAAALLLTEGQDAERVAAMLNLPLTQVHLIRDLQQVAAKEKKPRHRPSEESMIPETSAASNSAALREKTAARPILLVDAIKSAAGV